MKTSPDCTAKAHEFVPNHTNINILNTENGIRTFGMAKRNVNSMQNVNARTCATVWNVVRTIGSFPHLFPRSQWAIHVRQLMRSYNHRVSLKCAKHNRTKHTIEPHRRKQRVRMLAHRSIGMQLEVFMEFHSISFDSLAFSCTAFCSPSHSSIRIDKCIEHATWMCALYRMHFCTKSRRGRLTNVTAAAATPSPPPAEFNNKQISNTYWMYCQLPHTVAHPTWRYCIHAYDID